MNPHAGESATDARRSGAVPTLRRLEPPAADESFVAVVGTATDGAALTAVAHRLLDTDGVLRNALGSDGRPKDERERYAALARRRRLVVVTDRPSTVDDADRIYVVADGGVVETGTHAALVRRRGTYARLYGAQFGQDWLRETADVADE
ncbi:hypothetical protein [Halogeometricum sp. CBA1124]|uniref:hypothetical protein n=1 Tax=Halogeometricum sp. CBA1124 TaxID=2668071 RepID=UPI001429A672|nr:hypothetical protein [Halogeometricum sp. CBA1124]MUV58326.1 hypothetical protein [Halogeometricum sp. CBA1124]